MAGGIWVVAQAAPSGGITRLSAEVATLARSLGDAGAGAVTGIVVGQDPGAAATDLARYVPRVLTVTEPTMADVASATIVGQRIASLAAGPDGPAVILTGADPEGRDVAGVTAAILGWPVLANALGVTWGGAGPQVEISVFGGKQFSTSEFTAGSGVITVRPNVVQSAEAASPGTVEPAPVAGDLALPSVRVVGRTEEARGGVAVEDARIVVAGGRGIGGPDGVALLDDLAEVLGGAVGATRAAVDAGWIDYSKQIGQTGKIVKPSLYLALGISGAIQHKVGMQTAETIVAVNRDPDAPIAEFADVLVVGDLFEVGRALLAELRARRG
jgi:electron transfer flavoprotein alpha subunit